MFLGKSSKKVVFCLFVFLIGIMVIGCHKNEPKSNDSPGTDVVNGPADPVTADPVINEPVVVGTREKIDPRITLEANLRTKYFLGYSGSKSIRITDAKATYNDFDLAFPTVLVTITATVVMSKDTDEAIPVGYYLWNGLPPSDQEKGVISLGAGYNAGDELTYVLEIDGLDPGIAYCLEFFDARDTMNNAGEDMRNALLEDGRVYIQPPYFPPIETANLYGEDFVVQEVDPLSFSVGHKYDAISFVFRDADGKSIGAPATADIKFVGDSGVTRYESSVTLTKENFRELYYDYLFDNPKLDGVDVVGKILIPVGNLINFDDDSGEEIDFKGTLFVTFYNEGVFPPIECSCDWIYMDAPSDINGGYIYDEISWPDSEPGVVY